MIYDSKLERRKKKNQDKTRAVLQETLTCVSREEKTVWRSRYISHPPVAVNNSQRCLLLPTWTFSLQWVGWRPSRCSSTETHCLQTFPPPSSLLLFFFFLKWKTLGLDTGCQVTQAALSLRVSTLSAPSPILKGSVSVDNWRWKCYTAIMSWRVYLLATLTCEAGIQE